MTSVNRADVTFTYRRGVFRRGSRLFAGRGIALPRPAITLSVIAAALLLGLGAGWLSASLPDMLAAEPSVTPSPSPSSLLDEAPEPSIGPLAPITRTLGADDAAAGILSTQVPMRGDGTFTVVPGVGEPTAATGDVRWVSVTVEDGLDVDAEAFRDYVMDVLNDNRAWGSGRSIQYVPTDGVADYRVMLASPYTAAALCPNPHEPVEAGPVAPASASPSPEAAKASPSPSPETDEAVDLCAGGVVMVSLYDWTAGIDAYANDYSGARAYQVLHRMGHVRGLEDVACTGERADAMVNQTEELPEGCAVNPWPFPDASPTLDATPSPTPGATTDAS